MIDEERLDDLFRERLQSLEQEPPPEIWQRIRSQLPQRKNSRRIVWFRWSAAAAMLFIAISTGILLTYKNFTNGPVKMTVKAPDQNQNPDKISDNQHSNVSLFDKRDHPTASSGKSVSTPVIKKEIPDDTFPGRDITFISKQDEISTLTSLKKIDPLLLASADEISLKLKPNYIITEEKGATGKDLSGGESLKSDKMRKSSGSGRGWSVGIRINPEYSSYTTAYTDAYASKLNPSGRQARTDLGGGISIRYSASSRWQIESGLQYSQSSDKPEGARLFASKAYYDASPETGYKFYNSSFSADNGQPSVNGMAGIIQFDKTPASAELVTLPESTIGLSTALLTSGELSQVFDFIEFPLKLHYRLLNKKPVIDIFSGISTNFLVGNNVFLQNPAGSERVGKTKDISTLSFSGTAGIGLMIPLSKRLTFSFEPQTSYSLNSLNHSPDVEFRPWRIGVYSGLNYNF